MGYSLANVDKWTYKSKEEIKALSDEKLLQVEKDLTMAIRLFRAQQVPLSDEMFWQLMTIPGAVKERGLKSLEV